MKQITTVTAVSIGVLLLASLVASWLQPSPVDVARAVCMEHAVAQDLEKGDKVNRFRESDLMLHRLSTKGVLFGSFGQTAEVEFQQRGLDPAYGFRVRLTRPTYFLGWRYLGYSEGKLFSE